MRLGLGSGLCDQPQLLISDPSALDPERLLNKSSGFAEAQIDLKDRPNPEPLSTIGSSDLQPSL